MEEDQSPSITTDEQLRSWLLGFMDHTDAQNVDICGDLLSLDIEKPGSEQRSIVNQVIECHNLGEGSLAHELTNLFNIYKVSKLDWSYETATLTVTKYILKRFFKKFPPDEKRLRSLAVPDSPLRSANNPEEEIDQHEERAVFKLPKETLRTKHSAYDQEKELHYGLVLQRVDTKKRAELSCGVLGQDGDYYTFKVQDMEDGHKFMLYTQVVFQLPDVLVQESLKFTNLSAYRGSYVSEITTTNRHLLTGRFYLDGTVGPLTTPESTGNGGGKGHKGGKGGKGWKKKAGGSYHEIHIDHAINDRFTTVKYWPKNDFMGDVGLKEGDRVQLTTLVTGSNDFRWPVIDQLILDHTTKERSVRMATDSQLQSRLHDHEDLQVRYELGSTDTSSMLPGFPAVLEGSLNRERSNDLISQMLTKGRELHQRQVHNKTDMSGIHAKGLKRLERANTTKLTVLINPFTFDTIAVNDWPRLIDVFFNGGGSDLVDKFLLMTRVHGDTDEHNFFAINDFDYRFHSDVANHLHSAHIVDHTVFGVGVVDIFDNFEVSFKDYGDSPKMGLLVFKKEELAHTHDLLATPVSSGRLQSSAEDNSVVYDHYARDTVITVSYETSVNGLKQREARSYLAELEVKSVPKDGAPLGWEQRHVRCADKMEAEHLLRTLLQPPAEGENPLLAIIDDDFANLGTKIKFDTDNVEINHLFLSITGRLPAAPIGDGSFVCVLPHDLDKPTLTDRCLKFNCSSPPYPKPNFVSITDRFATCWLVPPKVPARLLRATMGRGPGHLLIPNVNYAISTTALHAAIGSLYPDFKPGESSCDFVELGKGGGAGGPLLGSPQRSCRPLFLPSSAGLSQVSGRGRGSTYDHGGTRSFPQGWRPEAQEKRRCCHGHPHLQAYERCQDGWAL